MNRTARGFTHIEVLTVVTIIGLLIALLLPAVQSVREGGRAIACQSKLRGLAQAALQYHDVHGTFPGWGQWSYGPDDFKGSAPSIHAQLLPFLDSAAMYDQINFVVDILGDHLFDEPWRRLTHATVAATRVAAFMCASDRNTGDAIAPNSYRGCWGVGPMWHQTHLFPDSQNGALASAALGTVYKVDIKFIFDGTSHTALFSERVVGGGEAGLDDRFTSMVNQVGFEVLGAFTADDELRVCHGLNQVDGIGRHGNAGWYWFYSGAYHTLYTHVLPPNASPSDCLSTNYRVPLGAVTARSYHPGAVHVAFADASVRIISDQIGLPIWRALASRNGGDSTGNY